MATATKTRIRVDRTKRHVGRRIQDTVTGKITIVYTKPFVTDGREYHGRLPNGRIGLNQKENRSCIEMLKRGIGHEAIADELDMTLNQVQYRAKLAKVSVMSYRKGESLEAKVVLRRFTVRYKH